MLLAHDRIALAGVPRALRTLANDPDVHFATLDTLLVEKYGCDAVELGDVVRGASGWW